MKIVLVALASLLAISLAIVGCTTPTEPAQQEEEEEEPIEPQYGGDLTIIWHKGPKYFGFPPKMMGDDFIFASPCIENLVSYGEGRMVQPKLATGWTVAPDGKSLTIELQPGVKFHDGTDFDAEAAKWNLENNAPASEILSSLLVSIDVIDTHTIRLNLADFSYSLLNTLTEYAGMMISPTAVAEHGEEWAWANPVGTGPFEFYSYEPDTSLKYVAFNDYWKADLPYLDSIEFDTILDTIVGGIAFQMGEGDMIIPTTPVAIDLKGMGYSHNTIESAFNTLLGNMTSPESPLSNKNVRQAMEYAIDKAPAMTATGGGFWIPEYQVCPPSHPSYIDPFVGGRTQDVNLAKQLLADSPWPTGFDITLVLASAFFPRPDLFVIYQEQWAEIGINVEIEVVSYGAWAQRKVNGIPKDEMTTAIIGTKGDWALALSTYYTTASGLYPSMVRPAGFDEAVSAALEAPTLEEHVENLQTAQMLLFEDATCVPLMTSLGYCFYQDNVHDHNMREFHEGQWTPETCWLSD